MKEDASSTNILYSFRSKQKGQEIWQRPCLSLVFFQINLQCRCDHTAIHQSRNPWSAGNLEHMCYGNFSVSEVCVVAEDFRCVEQVENGLRPQGSCK